MSQTPCHIVVSGRVDDKNFHDARRLAEELAELHDNVTCEITPMFGTDWSTFVREETKRLGVSHKVSPMIVYNRKHYVGGSEEFATWVEQVYGLTHGFNSVVSQSVARKEFRAFLEKTHHSFCYLDVATSTNKGEIVTERVVIELFDDICPKTVHNFKLLCCGERQYTYENSPFHRVVENGWVQGGDVVDGSGAHSIAAFGETDTFPDETFAVKHDRAGIVSMANTGKSHSNGSQFFVTLGPMEWLDYKRVAFGRVIYGMRSFHLIEKLPRKNERPVGLCRIYRCGLFDGTTSLSPSKYTPRGEDDGREEKEGKY